MSTLDVDYAHAGRNISVALPADLHINVHGALESLEMGLLPIAEFNGSAGAQYRNPQDQELRLDFVTGAPRGGRMVVLPGPFGPCQPGSVYPTLETAVRPRFS